MALTGGSLTAPLSLVWLASGERSRDRFKQVLLLLASSLLVVVLADEMGDGGEDEEDLNFLLAFDSVGELCELSSAVGSLVRSPSPPLLLFICDSFVIFLCLRFGVFTLFAFVANAFMIRALTCYSLFLLLTFFSFSFFYFQ
jgi:hypothetical protein